MKLDMQLAQTGYKPSVNPPRLSVWLTNALEPAEREIRDLFFAPLAEEARGASDVKRQTPIMCVIGNPPYSGESVNKGDHIMALMEAYKKEPGGKEKLKERNPKWINDDYVKFIRMSEDLITKKPSGGVLSFITNHGYLDNPTFRGMRWHLLKTFDRVWIVDLHGNSNKKEIAPDGSPDSNVFDIMQGVAVIIAVRSKGAASGQIGQLFHADLWGTRRVKYEALWASRHDQLATTPLEHSAPLYPFVPRDYAVQAAYGRGFSISELMPLNSVGIVTARDAMTIDMDRQAMWDRVVDMTVSEPEDLRTRYALGEDVRDWRVEWAKADVVRNFSQNRLAQISYRPFDHRSTYYTGNSRGFMCYPRDEVMRHMIDGKNISIMSCRQAIQIDWHHLFVADRIVDDSYVSNLSRERGYNYPLYLYPDQAADQSDAFAPKCRTLNFAPKLYAAICTAAGIDPADQAGPDDDFRAATGDARPSEVKVFDYIYGVLHAPNYRETYAEFLKIDFPRIPYPASPEVFARVSGQGEKLRRLHLMEPAAIGDAPYPFEGEGDDVVAAGYPKFEDGKVWINPGQYFADVPALAWGFRIGGYQPAQKWLKDRRGRVLSWDDIGHYQKIAKILIQTDRIMREIDLPLSVDAEGAGAGADA